MNNNRDYGRKLEIYCSNCCIVGHASSECKTPITSIGIIAFKYIKPGVIKYLMIRRRHTFGFMEFIKCKFLYNKQYLLNIVSEMTLEEKNKILNNSYENISREIWGRFQNINNYDPNCVKFNELRSGVNIAGEVVTTQSLINETNTAWHEPEWGFPKGKRDNLEKDMSAAIREFYEETGIPRQNINMMHNVSPIEEVFIGSNFKSYKTKYFLAHLSDEPDITFKSEEVGALSWRNYEETLDLIRDYNYEKKTILTNVNKLLTTNNFIYQM